MPHIRMNWRAASACMLVFALMCCVTASAETTLDKTPVLLDCAVGNGIDDAMALALAATDTSIELLGVTTVSGNAEDRAWMICRFLSTIGKDRIPVAFGRGKQPPDEVKTQFQYRYHPAVLYGRTAKPVKQSAVELMHEMLVAGNVKTTIVCTGPLTNIAQLLAEHREAKERIERIVVSGSVPNLGCDVTAARSVFASGIHIDLLPWESGKGVRLDDSSFRRLFGRCTLLTLQLQTLYELDAGDNAHPDAASIALARGNAELKDAFALIQAKLTIHDDGQLTWTDGESPIRIVKSLKAERILDWMQKQLSAGEPALPRKLGNRTTAIDRGGMPHRVHVFEDYETDIERRWWLAGVPVERSDDNDSRHCRGMLTMDFDDKQGDTKTMYRAVVFNPVPGPPTGKKPRLSFRCWLRGTDELRVQIYSLTNGYHRYLSLTDLPQGKWLDLAVDMTAARRHDGSGGPLSENERIDDIQFYVDPRAELFIDDVVLYDASAGGEKQPFPKHIRFTGWFDTGKQGQEWPGKFEIPADGGFFWKAARSIRDVRARETSIRVHLRGSRPLTGPVRLDFRYRLQKAAPLNIFLVDSLSGRELKTRFDPVAAGSWQHASLAVGRAVSGRKAAAAGQDMIQADELHFVLAGEREFWLDDVLLYETDAPSP